MKKKKLKRWVKTTLGVIIVYLILMLLVCIVVNRVEYFNNNVEKCGMNYCNK